MIGFLTVCYICLICILKLVTDCLDFILVSFLKWSERHKNDMWFNGAIFLMLCYCTVYSGCVSSSPRLCITGARIWCDTGSEPVHGDTSTRGSHTGSLLAVSLSSGSFETVRIHPHSSQSVRSQGYPSREENQWAQAENNVSKRVIIRLQQLLEILGAWTRQRAW